MTIPIRDRALGCILGGALGDAWGGSFEGAPGPVSFAIPQRSVLSDDTQLTLATCESLIERRLVDPENLAAHFLRWFQEKRISGIGASTLQSMQGLAAGVHWALVGRRGDRAAGNGAAMRIAPLAFILDPANARDRIVIRDVCRITHHNDEAYVGALAVLSAIHAILSGKWSLQVSFLAAVVDSLPDSAVRDRIQQLLPLHSPPAEIAGRFGSSGYVVDTVPLALYSAQAIATLPFSTVLAQTIAAGGDTDTIASIAGQLAGCVTGLAGVPHNDLASVNGGDEALSIAHQFADFVTTSAVRSSS
jgi:ADP-ribosyl-[dinitrogen reductase] hydrolase